MSKHTPGPWAFCNETLCQASGNYLHLGKYTESAGLGHAAEANKRLIAAAPDLLDALKWVDEMVSRNFGVDGDDLDAISDRARAVIAKATGDLAGMWDAIPADERAELTRAFAEGFAEQSKGGAQ